MSTLITFDQSNHRAIVGILSLQLKRYKPEQLRDVAVSVTLMRQACAKYKVFANKLATVSYSAAESADIVRKDNGLLRLSIFGRCLSPTSNLRGRAWSPGAWNGVVQA